MVVWRGFCAVSVLAGLVLVLSVSSVDGTHPFCAVLGLVLVLVELVEWCSCWRGFA